MFGCDTNEHPSESLAEGAIQGGLSHEHNESITDPELSAWFGPEGSENGDKCRTFVASSEYGKALGTAPDGAPFNQVVGGVEYWYQQEWSNLAVNCQQRLAPVPPLITKLTPKSGAPAAARQSRSPAAGSPARPPSLWLGSCAAFKVNSDTSITATRRPARPGTPTSRVTGAAARAPS